MSDLFNDGTGSVPDDQAETPAETPVETPAETPAVSGVPEGYEFVRMPDGSVHAIPSRAIVSAQVAPETAVSQAPKPVAEVAKDEHFWVWLANGIKRRVKQSDLPPVGGTNAPYGHWQEDGKVHHVVGVYPVETEI